MDLVPHIYHEKQERGSMLCGQHALNNLLQSGLFTAPDLAEIARGLDALEASQLGAGQHLMGDSPWESSQNYDDSGFFSVQVMENALKVWGLRLVRWGSKEMQQVHDRPELVEGFLLNHQLHWFSIRQFGNSDCFYNLDSCIPEPVWISAMYLGLTLREMERQGYSIFAVVSATDGQLGGLPPCAAEEVARTLPPPRGGGSNGHSNSNSGPFSGSGHWLGGGGSNAFASTSATSTSSGSGSGAFSTTMATNGQNGFASSARKGKRAASPDDVMGQDDHDDDDDDIIIEEGSKSKSSVDSESEKRRRRRRLEQDPTRGRGAETAQGGGGGGGAGALPPGAGLSEEEQMAAAIAASLNVSGSGATRGEGGSGASSSAASDVKVPGRAALSEEEEFRRAVAASLAEANNTNGDDGGGGITESEASEDEGAGDSPTMEELRRRRMARFGA